MLQDKLRISNKKLEEYETRFKCQEETTQKLMLEYQARLEESEERLRRQQEDKEIQMKGIISRYGEAGGLEVTAAPVDRLVLELTLAQEKWVSSEVQARFPCGFSSICSLPAPLGYSLGGDLKPWLWVIPIGVTWHFTESQRQNFRRGGLAAPSTSQRIWQVCFSVHMSNRCNN